MTQILKKLITEKSAKLSRLMKDGDLIIKFLGGVSKLNYEIRHYQDMLCSCFILVDNDEASKSILPKLLEMALLHKGLKG